MRRPGTVSRPAAALLVLLAAALLLPACGKRGKLAPPEGEGSRYTHPRFYPNPETVLPAAAPAPAEEEEEQAAPPPDDSQVAPRRGLSPFPPSHRRTRIDGAETE